MTSVPLRLKFLAAFLLATFLFGAANLVIFQRLLHSSLSHSLERRGRWLAGFVAEQSLPSFLQQDRFALESMARELMIQDPDVLYLVAYDRSGKAIADTFGGDPPAFLANAGPIGGGVQRLKSEEHYFLDFTELVGGGTAGRVRMGLAEDALRAKIRAGQIALGLMILVFTAAGSAAAFLLAKHVAEGAGRIVQGVEAFRLDGPPPELPLKRRDEIGRLARHLQGVLERQQAFHRERRNLEERLRQMERVSSMGILASSLAHEINNPVAGLLVSLQRIQRDPSNTEQVRNYMGSMLSAAEHIRDVIQNLLSYIRRQPREEEVCAVGEALQRLASLVGHRLRASGVSLEVSIEEGLPPVKCPPTQLLQVLLNLVLNGAESLEGKSGRVEVSSRLEKDRILLEVRDDGAGMDEAALEGAFKPFFTTKAERGGTGLGLAVCRQIARESGGEIEISSRLGVGTLVRLTLRRA